MVWGCTTVSDNSPVLPDFVCKNARELAPGSNSKRPVLEVLSSTETCSP